MDLILRRRALGHGTAHSHTSATGHVRAQSATEGAVVHSVALITREVRIRERRFHETLAVVERRIADAVTHQTRTLVWSQLGAVVVIAGLAFGLR